MRVSTVTPVTAMKYAKDLEFRGYKTNELGRICGVLIVDKSSRPSTEEVRLVKFLSIAMLMLNNAGKEHLVEEFAVINEQPVGRILTVALAEGVTVVLGSKGDTFILYDGTVGYEKWEEMFEVLITPFKGNFKTGNKEEI